MNKLTFLALLSFIFIQCQSDLNNEAAPERKIDTSTIDLDKFDAVPSDVNYVIAVPAGDDMPALKNKLKEYNTANGYNDLRASQIFLGDNKENVVPIIIYRRFESMKSATDYGNFLKQFNSGEDFKHVYPISQMNYRRVLKNKNVESYMDFYEKNYVD